MSTPIDINKILELLPHRYPFLLIDKIVTYKEYDFLTAIKNVTINEPFFTGHFPENPIMPGVLILEALAQAGALLSSLSRTPNEGYKFIYFFAGIDNARFKQIVIPGDQLRLEAKITNRKGDFWRFNGEAYVEDKLVCSAELLSASKQIPKDNSSDK
jgi:3-hydroxyacyl-[acyl-carrier-protein] dehydratase